jgi:hypothetical protein
MKELREMTYNGYHLNVMYDEAAKQYSGDVMDRQLPRLHAGSLHDLELEFHGVIDALVQEEIVDEPNLLDARTMSNVVPLGGGLAPALEVPALGDFEQNPDEGESYHHEKIRKQEWED